MNHYHVSVINWPFPIVSIPFEVYEDSLACYVKVANALFGSSVSNRSILDVGHAKDATENGNASASIVGITPFILLWHQCDLLPCVNATWN